MSCESVVSLRSLDATDASLWSSGKGPSLDRGVGSKAVRFCRLASDSDPDAFDSIKNSYDVIVSLLDSLPPVQQQAVCLSVASNFTFDSIVSRAKSFTVVRPSIAQEASDRLKACDDYSSLSVADALTRLESIKSDIRAERKQPAACPDSNLPDSNLSV